MIAHTASHVSFAQADPEPILRLAVRGTEGVLSSAVKHAGPQLKIAILASSAMAVASPDKPQDYVYTEADWNTFATELVEKRGKDTPGNVTYAASKTVAEQAFWKFQAKAEPPFAMAAINPA